MICVPRGNRVARVDQHLPPELGCDVAFDRRRAARRGHRRAEPPGTLTSFPVVFEAAPDAPVAGALRPGITVRDPTNPACPARCTKPSTTSRSTTHGTFHSSTKTDSYAVAVIEEAPFRIDPRRSRRAARPQRHHEPQGHRHPQRGLRRKITVSLLWKPPGVGARPPWTSRKGQRGHLRRSMPTATPRSPSGGSACRARQTPRKGRVLVASALVPLEVAEPYLGMKIEMAATQHGQRHQLLCTLDQPQPFDGKRTVHPPRPPATA